MGLVALDLEQVVAALFHNGARQLALTVQGVGGDEFAIQRRLAFQQRSGGTLLATLSAFFLVIDG